MTGPGGRGKLTSSEQEAHTSSSEAHPSSCVTPERQKQYMAEATSTSRFSFHRLTLGKSLPFLDLSCDVPEAKARKHYYSHVFAAFVGSAHTICFTTRTPSLYFHSTHLLCLIFLLMPWLWLFVCGCCLERGGQENETGSYYIASAILELSI